MKALISSSYNQKNKYCSFLLDEKKIILSNLLKLLELKSIILILDDSRGIEEDFSHLFEERKTINYCSTGIYEILENDYDVINHILLKYSEISISIFEPNSIESKVNYLKNPTYFNDRLVKYRLAKTIIDINKYEREIHILISEVSKEDYKNIKDNIICCFN